MAVLKANAMKEQLKSGFNWACEYGRTSVADFLWRTSIDPSERHRVAGLHCATYDAHAEIVKLLLERKRLCT
jgi:hypothetical protein